MIKTVQGGVLVKIRKHTAVLVPIVIQEGSLVSSVIMEVDQREGSVIVDGVTMTTLAVVVAEVALANMSMEIVAGVTNQMKMIGQSHSHQMNAWNRNFSGGNTGLTLKNLRTFQLKQQATMVLHTVKVSVMLYGRNYYGKH